MSKIKDCKECGIGIVKGFNSDDGKYCDACATAREDLKKVLREVSMFGYKPK